MLGKIQSRKRTNYHVDILSRFSYSSVKLSSDSRNITHRLFSSGMGVSVMRFDRYGSLFAVGGTNGTVRVYDFDECLFYMYHKKEDTLCIDPVVVFDTAEDISDIQWSLIDDDVIFISFSFYPEVLVLNLNDTNIRKILSVGKDATSGHKSLLLLPSFDGSPVEIVIVGAYSSGVIRSWYNYKSRNRVTWEIEADPTYSIGKSAPVVSVLPLNRIKGGIVAANSLGIITVWDCEHLSTATFGSSRLPVCLLRLSLFDHLISSLPLTKIDHKLIGLEYDRHLAGDLIASFSTGYVCSFDLSKGGISNLEKLNQQSNLMSTDYVRIVDDFGQTIQLSHSGMNCPAVHLRVLDRSYLLLQDIQSRDLIILSHAFNEKYKPSLAWTRCLNYTFTLPGQIMNCQQGSKYLEISHDLSEYLVCSVAAPHCTSKSHQIKFEWQPGDCDRTSSDVNKSNIYSIGSIFGRAVTLDFPYLGPTVKAGYPFVHLRTNLQAHSSSPPCEKLSTKYRKLPSDSSLTRICDHPSLEYAIVGFQDNSLKILHIGAGMRDE